MVDRDVDRFLREIVSYRQALDPGHRTLPKQNSFSQGVIPYPVFHTLLWAKIAGLWLGVFVDFAVKFWFGLALLITVRKWLSRDFWMLRRRSAIPAKDVVERDPRRPVLLLRSFADDGLRIKGLESTEAFTFEEVITGALRRWRPVVAIGRPGESLPESGAAREYVTHEGWQEPGGRLDETGRSGCSDRASNRPVAVGTDPLGRVNLKNR